MSIMEIVAVGLGVVAALLGVFYRSFFAEKAKNLASKQDIADVTKAVEDVKASYRLVEELTRASLARQATIHKAQLDMELPLYKDLWLRIYALERSLNDVQVHAIPAETEGAERHLHAFSEFQRLRGELDEEVRRHEPFVDPSIHRALMIATLAFRSIAADSLGTSAATEEQKAEKVRRWVEQAATGTTRISRCDSCAAFCF